jgi:hypothetical protein
LQNDPQHAVIQYQKKRGYLPLPRNLQGEDDMKTLLATALALGLSGFTPAHAEWEILDNTVVNALATTSAAPNEIGTAAIPAPSISAATADASCSYRSFVAWGDNADFSQFRMLPNNPYWVRLVPANSPQIAASADHPCAGQPGYVLFAVDPSAAPLPIMTADW